jgi:ketosteroid isomerase-like protein
MVGSNTPDEVVAGFGAALRAGNAGAAAALFSRHGCFVTPDATVIRERSQIHGVLQQLIDMAGNLTIAQRTILTAGDVAVSSESWSIRSEANDSIRRSSRATIILGRIEGIWRIAVLDPWTKLSSKD